MTPRSASASGSGGTVAVGVGSWRVTWGGAALWLASWRRKPFGAVPSGCSWAWMPTRGRVTGGLSLGRAAALFLHHAHEFVAQHVAGVKVRDLSTVQVQIGTADGRGGHTQNQIVFRRQYRVGHGFHPNILATVIGQCLHDLSPCGRSPQGGISRGQAR